MDAISAPFTPMFEPFPALCRIHASVPARKQALSTAHPHGLPTRTSISTSMFCFRAFVFFAVVMEVL